MTIYALSSGPGISGVAVIRISGKETSKILKLITKKEINIIESQNITETKKKLSFRKL